MTSNANIRRILIVGGGTAGWMAAAYLNRFLRRAGCSITLVESADIGTIGVGEATVPALVRFVRSLRFDEDEFMRACYASYKLGIRFFDWVRDGHSYWHPFGLCGGTIDGLDLFHYWLRSVRAGRDEGPYSSYSLQALLGEADKAPRPFQGASTIMETGAYAYHLDAAAFADFLEKTAVGEGVDHLFDDVSNVVLDAHGRIERVETTSGRSLTADLYVDCTGFRGRLIEQALGDPWIDWSHLLLCDRAAALPLPRDPRMHPYTRSTALSAGWLWQIPLSHRVGCGYVYSSAHLPDDAAARELLARASPGKAPAATPRFLKMRVGRRGHFWVKNCVAVGLASGFVEPLESTGILFIQRSVELLLEHFPDGAFNDALVAAYNRRMEALYERVRDFILLHYLLTRREDTPFWRDCRTVAVPDSLRAVMELYDENGTIEAETMAAFPETSYHHIFSGGERLPRRPLTRAELPDFAKVCAILEQIKAQNREWAETLPAHGELMERLHRPPL